MEREPSARQVRVMAFAALLSPLAGLPPLLAKRGGALGWVSLVILIPLAVLGLWMLRRLGPGGLGRALARLWGPAGRGVTALYYIWMMALSALTAGTCVDRLERTDYALAPAWVLSLALGVAAWYLTLHGRRAFLRAAQIFFLALVGLLLLLFLLGVWRVDWPALVPEPEDVPGALAGVAPAAGTLAAAGLPAAFFPHEGPRERRGLWAPAAWCLVGAALCLLVLGALGPRLTAELPLPFFVMLQGLGVPGAFQRLEALGTAVWALSDLTFLGMTALAGRTLAGDKAWGAWPILLAGVLGGALLPAETAAPVGPWLWWAAILLGAGVPLALVLTQFFREGKKRG